MFSDMTLEYIRDLCNKLPLLWHLACLDMVLDIFMNTWVLLGGNRLLIFNPSLVHPQEVPTFNFKTTFLLHH